MTRWLETDSLTNQNIATALAIGSYTADADRWVVCQFFADQVAGNGDYEFYLTQQIGGSGSSYRHVPKTTAAVSSGVTAIAGQSIIVAVRSGDVLTLYLKGLAGDTTTPDTAVRWFELAALRPATADRQLTVEATGEASANVTLWKGATAPAMTGDAFARLGAPAGASVSADIAAIAAASAAGSGAISFPVTINDEDSNPIDGVEVWITTDSAGTNVVAGTLSTDALGVATFMLDAGDYYVWRQRSGYNFTNPVAITVS